MISTGRADRPAANQQVVGDDYMTPKQQQAANKSRYAGEIFDGVTSSAAQCQLFKFDSISALSNSIFDIIGLARTSQEYRPKIPQN